MKAIDRNFIGLPWKAGGRSFEGVDCVGLAWLWLIGPGDKSFAPPKSSRSKRAADVLQAHCKPGEMARGDVVLFSKRGRICHVAICLGEGKLLHSVRCGSRVDNGPTLLARSGYQLAGVIEGNNIEAVAAVLADKRLGEPSTIALLVISILLSAVSALMAPSLAGFKSKNGRYGENALITQRSPEIPLPDLLGQVVVAGNGVYQQLPDKGSVSEPQKWNQVIVLSSGPVDLIDSTTGIRIKGVDYSDASLFAGTNDGMALNPAQTKAEAVTGTISSDTLVPSISIYDGAHAISVPVDIRASYDRTFPLYGFSGSAYLVLRLINGTTFANFNVTARVRGRKLRTFNTSGFIVSTATAEALGTGDSVTVRFKLAFDDIVAVSSLTVGATSYTEISASSQSGNIYALNRTKGYVEFLTAPGASAITITYTYYARAWSQNPAAMVVYVLTENLRGRGFDAGRINWAAMVAARDYFDETVTWANGNGVTSAVRYAANYAIDDRKPITDHLRAILEACNSMLFLSNGQFVLKPRTAESSVFSFDTSNILVTDDGESTLEVTPEDRSGKPNRVRLFYHSDENLNAESDTPADDEDDQQSRSARLGNNGIVPKDLKLVAVTSLPQSERLGEMFVREQTGGKRVLKWTANIQGLALQPMDVVDVTHPILETPMEVRIDELEHDEQDRLVITAREYVESAVDL